MMTHVIRFRCHTDGKRPSPAVGRPIPGAYAWWTVTVESVYGARIRYLGSATGQGGHFFAHAIELPRREAAEPVVAEEGGGDADEGEEACGQVSAARCGGRLLGRVPGVQQNDRMTSPSGIGAGIDSETNRIRLSAAVAALATVGAGLGLRAVAAGDVAKYGGDALYTLLIFALVILAAPRLTAWKAGALALAVSWGVEFLQLSGLPAELSGHSAAARLILGSTFNAPDLFWYAVGALVGGLVVASRRAGRGRASSSL